MRLFNKKYIDALNLRFQNISIGEDLEFSTKIYLYNDKFSMANGCTYYYFMNDTSLTHTFTNHVYSIIESIENIEKFAKDINKFEKFYSTLEYINICHILVALMKNAYKIEGFNNDEVNRIVDYVESKYPKWESNQYINNLKDIDIEYLQDLKSRNYEKVVEYLSQF